MVSFIFRVYTSWKFWKTSKKFQTKLSKKTKNYIFVTIFGQKCKINIENFIPNVCTKNENMILSSLSLPYTATVEFLEWLISMMLWVRVNSGFFIEYKQSFLSIYLLYYQWPSSRGLRTVILSLINTQLSFFRKSFLFYFSKFPKYVTLIQLFILTHSLKLTTYLMLKNVLIINYF